MLFAFFILSIFGFVLAALIGFGLVEIGGMLGTSLAGRQARTPPTTQ